MRQHALEAAEREQHGRDLAGTRRLFAYRLPQTEERIWLITEASHAGATLLLPGEYRPGANLLSIQSPG